MHPDSAAPIGIFDSGLGGLAIYQAVRRCLPQENIIHLADSGFAPYGDRDAAFVEARACDMARHLFNRVEVWLNKSKRVKFNRREPAHCLSSSSPSFYQPERTLSSEAAHTTFF